LLLNAAVVPCALRRGRCRSSACSAPIEKVMISHRRGHCRREHHPAGKGRDATIIRRLTQPRRPHSPTGEWTLMFSYRTRQTGETRRSVIASPGFVRHQTALFEVMTQPEARPSGTGARDREYLTAA